MPLTDKGRKILAAMKKEYGDEKGEEIFYRSKNAGRIKGVDTADAEADIVGDVPRSSSPPSTRGSTSAAVTQVASPPQNNLNLPAPPPTMQPGSSVQVGDSLAVQNARNRDFWKRR